jgi:hypothetical protein
VPEGIIMDPEKLKAIQKWPTPRKKHGIRRFVGLCTYYSWSVSCFTDIAKPLTRLMNEKQAFQWTSEVEVSIQSLKDALCTTPIIPYLKPGERFIVNIHVDNVGILILLQVKNGWEQVMALYVGK